jgi:hypothetical protein
MGPHIRRPHTTDNEPVIEIEPGAALEIDVDNILYYKSIQMSFTLSSYHPTTIAQQKRPRNIYICKTAPLGIGSTAAQATYLIRPTGHRQHCPTGATYPVGQKAESKSRTAYCDIEYMHL